MKKTSLLNLVWKIAAACAIIALSFAISYTILIIPKAIEVSRKNSCADRLVLVEQVKELFASANKLTNGTVLSVTAIHKIRLDEIKCPAGGTYTIGVVGIKPTCSLAAHNPPASPGKSMGVIVRYNPRTNTMDSVQPTTAQPEAPRKRPLFPQQITRGKPYK